MQQEEGPCARLADVGQRSMRQARPAQGQARLRIPRPEHREHLDFGPPVLQEIQTVHDGDPRAAGAVTWEKPMRVAKWVCQECRVGKGALGGP